MGSVSSGESCHHSGTHRRNHIWSTLDGSHGLAEMEGKEILKGILIYPDILLESWQTFGSCSCLPHCFRSHEENVARMFSFSEHSRTV